MAFALVLNLPVPNLFPTNASGMDLHGSRDILKLFFKKKRSTTDVAINVPVRCRGGRQVDL